MSGTRLCPSAALLRFLGQTASLRNCPQRIPPAGRRPFHSSTRVLEERELSFRGQLYESTARRIKREREAEARFANMQPPTAFARNAAFTFGEKANPKGLEIG